MSKVLLSREDQIKNLLKDVFARFEVLRRQSVFHDHETDNDYLQAVSNLRKINGITFGEIENLYKEVSGGRSLYKFWTVIIFDGYADKQDVEFTMSKFLIDLGMLNRKMPDPEEPILGLSIMDRIKNDDGIYLSNEQYDNINYSFFGLNNYVVEYIKNNNMGSIYSDDNYGSNPRPGLIIEISRADSFDPLETNEYGENAFHMLMKYLINYDYKNNNIQNFKVEDYLERVKELIDDLFYVYKYRFEDTVAIDDSNPDLTTPDVVMLSGILRMKDEELRNGFLGILENFDYFEGIENMEVFYDRYRKLLIV